VHDNPQIEEKAFLEIGDLLILFNTHLSKTSTRVFYLNAPWMT
jgi:hypothetical protein